MYEIKEPRCIEWNKDLGHDRDKAKREILSILKEQKASLSLIRTLFNEIIYEIEDKNPTSL